MVLIEHPTNSVSEKVIGAAIEVHRLLGPGLLESSYHACLCRELEVRGIAYESELMLPIEYKGVLLTKGYVIDLVVEDSLIVDIKAAEKFAAIHSAQLMTYMRLRGMTAGLLVNSNVEILVNGIKRKLL